MFFCTRLPEGNPEPPIPPTSSQLEATWCLELKRCTGTNATWGLSFSSWSSSVFPSHAAPRGEPAQLSCKKMKGMLVECDFLISSIAPKKKVYAGKAEKRSKQKNGCDE